jgi:hypothetical protein
VLVASHKFAPDLSGVSPDHPPPLCPHSYRHAVWNGKAAAPSLSLRTGRLVLAAHCQPFGLARAPVCAPRPGDRGARLAAGGRPAAPDGRTPHLGMGLPSDGVSNTRPIVLAGCGLLNTRRDTRLGVAPSDKSGAKNSGAIGTRHRRAQVMDRQAGRDAHASSEPKTRQCRAPNQPPVKATRYAGGRTWPTLTAAGGAHA